MTDDDYIGKWVRTKDASGVVTDAGYSVQHDDLQLIIREPDDGRRPIAVLVREVQEVRP